MSVVTPGVTELVLEARDLQASERFYAGALGLPVVLRWQGPNWEGREAVWVLAGQTRIGLWQPYVGLAGSCPGAHVHFALTVAEADYDTIVDRIRSHGLLVHEYVFGADPRAPGQRSAYVEDPDGHIVELWTRFPATQAGAGPSSHIRTA